MNDAVGDQGPINPWNSARTRHVCRFLKLRVAVTLNEGLFINPESCILVPVSPYTSNRYCSGPNVGSNFGVAADAVSVGCVSLICASLMGDVGLGAETFNVDPSDDASSFVAAFELGDVGAGDCRLQANVSATAA